MFSHPVSGITHTLTVQEIEQQTVPQNSFGSDRWIYPTHYIAMSYTLTPEPMENISVFDCDEGDRPIEVTPDDHSFRPVRQLVPVCCWCYWWCRWSDSSYIWNKFTRKTSCCLFCSAL